MTQLKNKKNYQYSLSSRFLNLVFLFFISLVIYISWKTENIRKNTIQNDLTYITHNVAHNIQHNFKHTEDKLLLISSIIVKQKISNNLNKIHNLLNASIPQKKQDSLYWSHITWSDPNYNLKANDLEVRSKPFKLIYQGYPEKTSYNTLSFCKKNTSYIRKLEILPIAMRVTDQENKFIGTLTIGVEIEELILRIKNVIKNDNISYAIINLNDISEIVAKSKNFNIDNYPKIKQNITKLPLNKYRQMSFSIKGSNYTISKLKYSPFLIITGIDNIKVNYQDYLNSILLHKIDLLAGVILISFLIYLFYSSILVPFIALSKAAYSISNGDLETELPLIHSKEGYHVANALNKIKQSLKTEKELVHKLSDAHNKLSLTNLRLESKVSERTQELEKTLVARTSFLDHLSHEIRMPLQGINSITESLISFWNDFSDSKKLNLTHQVAYSTNRLLDLINNLLDLSKFSIDKMTLSLTRVDLFQLSKDIAEECKSLHMHQKQVNINFSNNNPIFITADKERIAQVLRNLFMNAIKFSNSNGSIAISIVPTDIYYDGHFHDAVHFMIYDKGIGIDINNLSSIFSPFMQGISEKTRSGCVGLGLSICREIISSHNGKIWAMNNKDGGATFNFILPVIQITKEQKELYNPSLDQDTKDSPPNILIIDDEESCLSSMEILLHGSKYNLIKSNSAINGLDYLREHYMSISLIMLDLMMPDMYGLNLLKKIKSDPNFADIPIILQTGSSDENEIVKALDMGIVCFIRKPYKKKDILEEIENTIRLRNLY
jgi:two-component system, sensor histidine kinase ChiS